MFMFGCGFVCGFMVGLCVDLCVDLWWGFVCGENRKVFFLVTLEASSCREE